MSFQSANREQNADATRYANAAVSNPLHYEMTNRDPCEMCEKAEEFYANNQLEEMTCSDHTCPVWLREHPKSKKRVKVLSISEWKEKIEKEQEPQNPCAGCKFRKYHDWKEPTWTGVSQHYYDCENPACPIWGRLWWRNKDDGTVLLDQEPIKMRRKIQHAAYRFVAKLNDFICKIFEK